MRAILVKNDLWGYTDGSIVKPEPAADGANANAIVDWKKNDAKAMSDIILSISTNELKQVKNCETAREMWTKLEFFYQSTSPARKATLLKNLMLRKMADNGDVRDHLTSFFDTVDKLNDMEVEINPDLLTVMLLYSLPAKYENFRIAIESRDTLPSPEALRVKIIEESEARSGSAVGASSDAMFANKSHVRYGQKNKSEKKNASNKDFEKGEFKYRCHKCRKIGHKAADCKNKKREDAKCVEEVCLMTVVGTENISSKWCLDSGASSHLCNRRDEFSKIDITDRGILNLANDNSIKIAGIGTVKLETDVYGKEMDVSLDDTLHVPGLRSNLMSVAKITDRGYDVLFRKNEALVLNNDGDVKLRAERIGALYFTHGKVRDVSNEVLIPEANLSFELWHSRMGHVNTKDLLTAKRKNTIRGMSYDEPAGELNCEICLRGKMVRKSFPKISDKQTALLDIIHTDVCGPMRVESLGRAKYFVLFIDDKSRWCEVRFVHSKADVFRKTVEFVDLVKNQKGMTVKCIQSDNGTEYTSDEFSSFLKERGIRRRLTIPYNPEQNGVSERKNRSLLETARCLMIESGLPPRFWAEAINTANYVRNRSSSKSLNGLTPYEIWTGSPPDVSSFRVFGSKVFYLDRNPRIGKFDDRGKEGIFVGYSEESKGYRIWSKDSKTVIISRDVKFTDECVKSSEKYEEFIPEKLLISEEIEKIPEVRRFADIPSNPVAIDILPNTPNADRLNTRVVDDRSSVRSEDGQSEQSEQEEEGNNVPVAKRGRGRPTVVRTGSRGRPRREYQRPNESSASIAEYACLAEVPMSQAMSSPHVDEWCQAIDDEIASIIRNDTWVLVDRPKNEEVIGSRIVLRNKFKSDGTLERRKARLVAQGFSQQPGVHYNDTFAPVARLKSIRLITSLASRHDMKIKQFDVTTAYLNGNLEEKLFMQPPKCLREILTRIIERENGSSVGQKAACMLEQLSKGDQVCLLIKSIYGLKQAGRAWYSKVNEVLNNCGATPTHGDPCVYRIGSGDDLILIAVYVDDFYVAGRCEEKISRLEQELSEQFDIKSMGDVKYCLGVEFVRSGQYITMHQRGYVMDLLNRFGMLDSKPVVTPINFGTKMMQNNSPTEEESKLPYRELIGALTYLATTTRPDISFAVSYLGQFNNCYDFTHWKAAKRVLRYLKGTIDVGLSFGPSDEPISAFVDADWANDVVDRRSFTGYLFCLGGSPVSWDARKQRTVAMSTMEAEYMALSECAKECVYLKNFLAELGFDKLADITIHCDSQSAIKLAKNPTFHARSKHIDVRYHYIREVLKDDMFELIYVPTENQIADMMTKGLPRIKHEWCVKASGMLSERPLNRGEVLGR